MTNDPGAPPGSRHRARWWIAGLVVAVAVCLAVTVVIFVSGRSTGGGAPTFHRGDWQPPQQAVLSSSMRVRPVAGWRTRATDLGLPDSSIIGTTGDATWSTPFVGSLQNNGYFLVSDPGAPDRQQWLVGLDARTGGPLFPPVKLEAPTRSPKCFVNEPSSVLCIADDVREGKITSVAWVIDADSGNVLFNGPTDLHTTPGSGVRVDQVGNFAVAELRGQGLYGIGQRAETTWSVPKTTKVSPTEWVADAAAPTYAVAEDASPGSDRTVVFSLTDGKVITPDLGEGRTPQNAVVYPDGFAVEATTDIDKSTPDVLVFFDSAGNRLGETDVSGFLSTLSMTLPMVKSSPSYTVFGANGGGLIRLPDEGLGPDAVLIGQRMFAPESTWEGPAQVRRWRQFDLGTGEEGSTCRPNMSHYVANDGEVGIFETTREEVTGATTFAMDLATCEQLWSAPVNPDSFHHVWRIGDTLVELSDDGTELHSLVAPG